MLEVAVDYFVKRRIASHKMTLKLLQNGVTSLKITLVWLDEALCDFFDVKNVCREARVTFFVLTNYLTIP